jgi:hypothetical protein
VCILQEDHDEKEEDEESALLNVAVVAVKSTMLRVVLSEFAA